MKKVLTRILALILLVSLVLSGCGGKNGEETAAGQGGTTAATQASSEGGSGGALPITRELTTLKFLVLKGNDIEDLTTNEFTKWAEQQTNVRIVWDVIPNDQAGVDKFKLVLASGGPYADVFYGCNITPDQEMMYGIKEGVFIPLNDLIEQYGNEIKKKFAEVDFLKDYITAPDGNIYSLPTYSSIQHVGYAQKYWINKSWLDRLSLKMPTTTDEFYEVLKAFKTQDPNRNGKQDEIPLAGSPFNWHSDVTPFLICSFILDEGMYSEHLTLNNGKIDTILNKPEYKEALKYLKKLYKEGLLYEGSFTQNSEQYIQIGDNKDAELLGCGAGGGAVMFLTSNNSPYYKNYVTLPPLKGPGGLQTTPHFVYGDVRLGAYAISKTCKNPEVALKLADFYYTREATMRFRFGVKDKDWRDAKPGEKGLDGRDAVWAENQITYTGGVQNQHYGNTGLFFETNDMFTMERAFDQSMDIMDPKAMQQLLQVETTKNYVQYGAKESVPPARYLPEEQSDVGLLKTEIKKYTDESRVRFITGDLDIDKDWDKYVQNLEGLQMSRYLEIYQKAYDRQYKR